MPLKIALVSAAFFALQCGGVKYNSHVGPDGANGYLRTYYSSEKEKAHGRSDGTGIEQCKVQGSDVICKDLNIIHAEDAAVTAAVPNVPEVKPAVKAEAAAEKAPPAKKAANKKK